jgi:hypothetical protein
MKRLKIRLNRVKRESSARNSNLKLNLRLMKLRKLLFKKKVKNFLSMKRKLGKKKKHMKAIWKNTIIKKNNLRYKNNSSLICSKRSQRK